MTRYTLRIALLLTALTLLVWAGAALADGPAKSAGCKTEHFLVTHLAGPFEAATGQKILPGPTGNKKAILLFADGKLDFAYTCKPHGKLAKKFQIDPAKTVNWQSTVIARDPIVVVAHPGTGITDLSMDQLKAVFGGQVANWSEVGGADVAVTTSYMDKTVDSGVVTVFKEVTVGKDGALDPNAKTLAGPSQLGNFTKSTAGAVTFMGLNSYEPAFGTIVSVNGVAPEKEFIVQGAYPLAVTYHVVYDKTVDGTAQAFLSFCGSAEGQALIDEIMVAIPPKDSAVQ